MEVARQYGANEENFKYEVSCQEIEQALANHHNYRKLLREGDWRWSLKSWRPGRSVRLGGQGGLRDGLGGSREGGLGGGHRSL